MKTAFRTLILLSTLVICGPIPDASAQRPAPGGSSKPAAPTVRPGQPAQPAPKPRPAAQPLPTPPPESSVRPQGYPVVVRPTRPTPQPAHPTRPAPRPSVRPATPHLGPSNPQISTLFPSGGHKPAAPRNGLQVKPPLGKPTVLSGKQVTGKSPLPPLVLGKIKPKGPVVKPGFGKFDLTDKKKLGPILPPQIVDKLKPKGPGIKPQIDDFKLAPPKGKPDGPGDKKPADQGPEPENPGDKKPVNEHPGEEPADQPEEGEKPQGGPKWPEIVVQFFPELSRGTATVTTLRAFGSTSSCPK